MQLGDKATDTITGLEGTVTAICEYLSASTRVQVQPPMIDGKFVDAHWFDVDRLFIHG